MDRKPKVPLHAVPTVADNTVGGSDFVDPVDAEFIARSNAISVIIDELWRGSDEIHKLPRDQMDWDGRMDCLARIFRGQRDKAFVVNSRLEAMSQLVKTGKVPYGVRRWIPPAGTRLPTASSWRRQRCRYFSKRRSRTSRQSQFAAFVLKDAKVCRDLRLRAVRDPLADDRTTAR